MGDFWRMIIEMDVNIIVMVANFIENGKVKVGPYFSHDGPVFIDNFEVHVLQTVQHPHYKQSLIEVTTQSVTKSVVHYQFIKWPDHGVPSQIFPLANMLKNVASNFESGCMVIHCSAGIGRTGAVLMVLLMRDLLEFTSSVDPIATLKTLRACRGRLVENFHQFNLSLEIFHDLVFGDKGAIRPTDFKEKFDSHMNACTYLYNQFVLQPINHSYTIGNDPSNRPFNRNPSILPSDSHVITNTLDLGNNTKPTYINAIYVSVEDIEKALIITEHPLPSTVYRFWKMILTAKCSTLVLINDHTTSEMYPSILPENGSSVIYGNISLRSVTGGPRYDCPGLLYEVTIHYENKNHTLEVVKLIDWPAGKVCPTDINVVASLSQYILQRATTNAPTILCCRDGVTGCGLVAAAINLLARLQIYQELNVYNTALHMRRFRPEFIISKKQFEALYEVIVAYLNDQETYQNFN